MAKYKLLEPYVDFGQVKYDGKLFFGRIFRRNFDFDS